VTPLAVLVILGSAGLHVVVHLALKGARDRTAFVWWMWVWAAVLFSPILLLTEFHIPPVVWVIMAVSAAVEALYHLAITRAYRLGDLSVVYPVARGTAPLFLFAGAALALGELPTAGALAGVGLIAGGLCLVNLPRLGAWRQAARGLRGPATLWALGAAVCISLYTMLDKVAVRSADALLYTYLVMTLTAVWLTPPTLAAVGWRGLKAEWRASALRGAAAGAAAMTAYAAVLWVMRSGAPASYVGATREVSIVFAAAAGTLFLKERCSATRLAGAALVSAGVAAIAVLG
jgi:drug/metabolite transporter (DMT)-like permease